MSLYQKLNHNENLHPSEWRGRVPQIDILLSEGLTNEVKDLCPEIWG